MKSEGTLKDVKNLKEKFAKRTQKALKWRAAALQSDPSLRTLIRPRPTATSVGPRAATSSTATRKDQKKKYSQKRFEWGDAYFSDPVDPDKVFYESFSGNGALCNPRAIFDYLLDDPRAGSLKHVWSFKDAKSERLFLSRYGNRENVKTVRTESTEYWREVCTSGFLFNNATFPPYFTKRPEQTYVNTWHGTPLKRMGYHSNEGAIGAANVLRNFLQSDYLVSPNEHTTQTMYLDAYRLRNFYRGTILETGYPRIDRQYRTLEERAKTVADLTQLGISLDPEKPTVIFAPTWRGASFHDASADIDSLREVLESLRSRSDGRWNILLKLHQQVVKQASDYPEFEGTLLPNSYPTNDILSIVDVVISDYSSVWIDFLQSERPILFYVPDKDDYVSLRGLYFDELPGPLISDSDTLGDFVEKAIVGGNWEFQSQLDDWKQKLAPYEDGHATQRVVEQVFGWNSTFQPKAIEEATDSRISLLLYLGGMKNNGITTAALNLLNSLDPNKYDVTAWTFMPGKNTDMSTYRRIPSHVRLLLRQGSHPLTEDRNIVMDRYVNDGNIDNYVLPDLARDGYRSEWRRNFGDQSFDHIIDFSGYAGFWSLILAQGEARIAHSIWLHNDLQSDRLREVGGERPHFTSLTSVFKSYQFYDNLVSVSKSLSEINSRNLSDFAPVQKFKFARNAQDLDNISDSLNDRVHRLPESVTSKFDMMTDLGTLRALRAAFSRPQLEAMINREESLSAAFDPKDDRFTFINAGRLSPEKNHERLISAFSLCHALEPSCRLIIVGDGPLRSKLESLVAELGLQNDVLFTGQQPQALDFIARSNCFVMSSDYEGQPMVITEALSVGVPVVTVRFGSVQDAMPAEDGFIVAPTTEALAAGMVAYASGQAETSVGFDVRNYNVEVLHEFEHAIGIVDAK